VGAVPSPRCQFFNHTITGLDTQLQITKQISEYAADEPINVPKKFKTQPSTGKLMADGVLDPHLPILQRYREHGTTVTNASYSDMYEMNYLHKITKIIMNLAQCLT
jgi:hypothetical protein